ncbi:MAG: PQQ-binding-like beta-propeller repeat protein, partial [Planctomycetota bacterium]|nr:PQQ-binding-like beta-propeller repeat protein [Planctomycetota bacterium]
APPADAILDATGIRAGLGVHVGATDGVLEIGLTSGGRMLVHGLALDDASLATARQAIQAKGLYGLASVEKAAGLHPLPYAENLVNLLVADLDALGAKAPPESEILRVLAPGGMAYLGRGGAWTKTVKPRPKEMDDWTHFDYGPEGNGVSHDRLVRPATFVQWAVGVQAIKLGGNPAGFRVYTSTRVAGGRAFFEWGAAEKGRRDTWYDGRDAFNGLPLWSVKNAAGGRKDWQFVAGPGRLYTFLADGGPLVALDAETGRVVRTFDQAGRLAEPPHGTALRLAEGTLLETSGNALYALDAATGALKWKYVEDKGNLFFPSAAAKADRVFAAVAEAVTRGSARWPVAKASAVVCLELATGRPVWRCTEIDGFCVGQLVYDQGNLAVFASGAIGGGEEPFIGNLRAADGKLLWHATFQKKYNRFGYNLLVRDGVMYYADAWRLYAHNMQTGEETRPFDDGGYNMRCNRFSATDAYFIYGFGTYVDRWWRGTFQSITRGGCAMGGVPANGMMYFTPNACGCITQLRGHVALSSEAVREPLPDDKRLEVLSGQAAGAASAKASALPEGPVAADWPRQDRAAALETAPVAGVDATLVAVIHEHRLEARGAAGKVLWSFTAGGRVSSPPVVHEGLCLFGSHDGWVYCLKAADGSPLWRFLAAPYEHKTVAYGQLESSWPVYGVAMHGGQVCFAAGVHPEVGGGIYIYGLEPKTGRLAWKRVLCRSPVMTDGKTRSTIRPNRVLGDVLKSDGVSLSLPGLIFTPETTDAELQKKIDGEDEAAKKRK